MFRLFESLVDPYTGYAETDAPQRRLWPFLWDYAQPFKRLFAITVAVSVTVAIIEVALIWYMGRLVDLLASAVPAEVLADHGGELTAAAVFILLLRPVIQGIDVALLNNAILPQFGALIRWRTHRQVLRQSVGWFENDFAGRIASRIMQTPGSAGDAMFQIFDAITFALAYLIGSAILLAEATSALDSVMEGKTVVAIADRRSTIARMDRVVVLDPGRIVEDGRHDALLARGGLYAGFWTRRSGGLIGTEEAAE